jgi:hypothetical protein
MVSKIYVYLFPDISQHIIKDNYALMKKIEQDTKTHIEYIKRNSTSYFSIEGDFENIHKARIILQEVEKDIYRECYFNHYKNSR